MRRTVVVLWTLVAALGLLLMTGCNSGGSSGTATSDGTDDPVKVGFIVKSMADSWFQVETKFAKEKAAELGVDLLVQEAKDADTVFNQIDSMATQGVQGIIICAPDVKMGAAIKARCDEKGIKLMSVDDQLLGADGQPLAGVPHLGISASDIGKMVGETIAAEAQARGWPMDEVGAIAVLVEGLQTAEERVGGASRALQDAGMPLGNIYVAPWTGAIDVVAATDAASAVITRKPDIKRWVCYSSNDDGMLGAVRALEQKGIPASDIIGVGINGKLVAQEFAKGGQSGVFGSVLLKASQHGGQTVEQMTAWIKDGTEPEAVTWTSGEVIKRDDYQEKIAAEGIELD